MMQFPDFSLSAPSAYISSFYLQPALDCNFLLPLLFVLLEFVNFLQDAHEFLYYLLNELVNILERESTSGSASLETLSVPENISNGPSNSLANGKQKEPTSTWVHKSFQVNHLFICNLLASMFIQQGSSIIWYITHHVEQHGCTFPK